MNSGLGYQFKDIHLLKKALRHRSVSSDNNKRLEFIGDSVLGMVIAIELYKCYPEATEGELSRMRAALVNGDILAEIAQELELGEYLQLGAGEQKTGGKKRRSILADAVEALLGAIYLESGTDACWQCVTRWYKSRIDELSLEKETPKDAKSRLQEWLQARQLPLPEYTAKQSGQAHALTFEITCRVKGLSHETNGVSTSRRRAEQIAANKYLGLLND